MSLQRITRIQVAIAGLALAVGIAVVFLLLFVRPQRSAIRHATNTALDAEEYAAGRGRVEAQIEEAKVSEVEVNEKWDKIMEERMPKLGFADPIAATVRMWDLAAEEQRVMDRWFASTGARVTGYGFPEWGTNMPGSFPDTSAMTLDRLNWNLTVEVKDFPTLLDWLLKLPEAPRFMVLDSVTIQGPRQPGQPLVAQVPVTLYQWTGVEPLAAAGPATTAAAGAGAGAGRGPRGGAGMRGGRGGRGGMRGMRGGRRGRRGGRF